MNTSKTDITALINNMVNSTIDNSIARLNKGESLNVIKSEIKTIYKKYPKQADLIISNIEGLKK
jgi:hypothetical protein